MHMKILFLHGKLLKNIVHEEKNYVRTNFEMN